MLWAIDVDAENQWPEYMKPKLKKLHEDVPELKENWMKSGRAAAHDRVSRLASSWLRVPGVDSRRSRLRKERKEAVLLDWECTVSITSGAKYQLKRSSLSVISADASSSEAKLRKCEGRWI